MDAGLCLHQGERESGDTEDTISVKPALWQMCDGTLSGNQTMGVLLLVGVMLVFASVVPWLLPPTQVLHHCPTVFSTLTYCAPDYLRSPPFLPPAGLLPLLRAAADQGDAAALPRLGRAGRHHPPGRARHGAAPDKGALSIAKPVEARIVR